MEDLSVPVSRLDGEMLNENDTAVICALTGSAGMGMDDGGGYYALLPEEDLTTTKERLAVLGICLDIERAAPTPVILDDDGRTMLLSTHETCGHFRYGRRHL
jgi:hypothetical protein